jgi:hypothetical protein
MASKNLVSVGHVGEMRPRPRVDVGERAASELGDMASEELDPIVSAVEVRIGGMALKRASVSEDMLAVSVGYSVERSS